MPQGDITLLGGGAPTQIAPTGRPGTTVWTAVSGTLQMDLVHLVLGNIDTGATLDVVIEVAGVTSAHRIPVQVRFGNFVDMPIIRVNNGALIKVYASITNKLNVYVDVDRYTL